MPRIRSILVVSTFLFAAFPSLAHATPIELRERSRIAGLTFADLAISIITEEIRVYGAISFPCCDPPPQFPPTSLGTQLALGHFDQVFSHLWEFDDPNPGAAKYLARVELFFEPTDLLTHPSLPPFLGMSVTRSFTMTGVLSARPQFFPGGAPPPIDLVGHGTFTAGLPALGIQSFDARFLPEPPSFALLGFGVVCLAFVVIKRNERCSYFNVRCSFVMCDDKRTSNIEV
jgi:hypothetical protein